MVGTADQTKNGPWLVKSGDRVLGPFSTDQVAQLLKDREIVVIDEIISPESRWAYIRDVGAFTNIVEDIRRSLMTSREDTEIQGYTGTVTANDNTPTQTQTQHHVTSETVTEIAKPITPVMAPRERKPDLKQLGLEPIVPVEPTPPSKRPPGLVIGGVIVVLALLFIIMTVGKNSAKRSEKEAAAANTESLQRQASVAWKRGEFPQALELYRAIDRQTGDGAPGQVQISTRLALLTMMLEGQTVEAKRILQANLEKTQDPEERSQIAIALGLAALRNENGTEAVTHFNSAGSTWIASFNRGVAYISLKEWAPAIKALSAAGPQPIVLLTLARAELSAADTAAKSNQSAAQRKEADATIAKGLSHSGDYSQELLVLGAYADILSGNKRRAETRVAQALDVDPEQTDDHFHDPSLSLEAASWQQLVPMCRGIQSSLESTAARALLGICLAKADRLEEASKTIETSLTREPSNSQLHSANAYLHMIAERDDAARASLTLSAKSGTTRLGQILSSRLCVRERQDACAEEGWSKLASEQNPPLAAYTGLAQLKFQKGDKATANALLVNAEKISPTYLPLLRLREDASR